MLDKIEKAKLTEIKDLLSTSGSIAVEWTDIHTRLECKGHIIKKSCTKRDNQLGLQRIGLGYKKLDVV